MVVSSLEASKTIIAPLQSKNIIDYNTYHYDYTLYVFMTMPASKAGNIIYSPKTLMTNYTYGQHSLMEHPLFWVYK